MNTESDTDGDSDNDSQLLAAKNKRQKISSDKNFKTYWLNNLQFRGWLLPNKNSKNKAICKELPEIKLMIIGIYCGKGKPSNLSAFLGPFVEEVKTVLLNGLIIGGNQVTVKLRCFVYPILTVNMDVLSVPQLENSHIFPIQYIFQEQAAKREQIPDFVQSYMAHIISKKLH
ncbi:unnamed protein product [Brassicogethes aeneus]|uniref:Uncharacterized protein n=1 Tax=Brassicogethes aeneus TaxID=1431903 RepID=A0A9P0FQ34_BRAAE|nr:unnamed protein product [Brassicogethes aeneus]